MTEEKMREALEHLRNHQQQMDQDGVMVGVSREALDVVLSALSTKQEAGEVPTPSPTGTEMALEQAKQHIDELTRYWMDSAGFIAACERARAFIAGIPEQEAGEVSPSQTAQALERLQIARLNGLFDASTELTMPGDSDNVPAILDAVEAALSLPAPGWGMENDRQCAEQSSSSSRVVG